MTAIRIEGAPSDREPVAVRHTFQHEIHAAKAIIRDRNSSGKCA